MNCASAEARVLKLEGTEFVSLFPDSALIDALAEEGIRPILARTERVAVDIADGYSRVTNGRKIGVCNMQIDAGIQNAFAGIAHAWADSSPVLVLPQGTSRRLTHTFPTFDTYTSFREVSKWADVVSFADRVPELMTRAFTMLRTGRPGPVVLDTPEDVEKEEFDDSEFNYKPVKGWKMAADPRDVVVAVRAILAAKNPIIYAGQGVLYAEAWSELEEFAELVQAPVMTTMTGKSAFRENHELSLGLGAHVRPKTVDHFLEKADLVLAVGAGLSRHWMQCPIPKGKTIVQLTNWEYDVNKGYMVDLALVGDAKLTLRQMIEEVNKKGAKKKNQAMVDEIAHVKKKWLEEWMPKCTSNELPINPFRVLWDLAHAVEENNTIVTAESGKPRDQLAPLYESITPRGYVGWGHTTILGFSLGLAMGAKLAEPKKLVVNVMGDGGIGMVGMDFETSVREKIPIMTIVLKNSTLSTFSYWPKARERYSLGFLTGDYAKMAEALGGYSERVEKPDEVIPAMKRAKKSIDSGRSALVEVITKLDRSTSSPPAS